MKLSYWIFCICMSLVVACKKSDTSPPSTPDGLAKTISSQLAKTDSLDSFNSFFGQVTLSSDEISGGITVFALPNSAFGSGTPPPGAYFPDSSLLKDYIVKGILKSSDLTDNKVLTTLSGKTLTITVNGDTTRVNGVVIQTTIFLSGDGYAVYIARQLFRAVGPIVISVWDATQWTSVKPKGDPAAQATVSLYFTQADYAAGKPAAYTAVTGSDGKAVFSIVGAGHYYAVASKGAINSVLNQYSGLYEGTYLGYASAGPQLNGTGGFVYKDVNADEIINRDDITALPFENFTAVKGEPVALDLSMGNAFEPLKTQEDVQTLLNSVYSGIRPVYENLLLIDGMMSDDAICETSNSYCVYDNFTHTGLSPELDKIWSNAYFTNIPRLNHLLRDIPTLNLSAGQKNDLIAQAKVLRGFIYLELLTYFGDIPVQIDLAGSFIPNISKSPSSVIYDSITNDLGAGLSGLPLTRTGDKQVLTKYAALGLLAKAALWKKDYTKARDYSDQIIDAAVFTLSPVNSWLNEEVTPETIWSPVFSQIGSTTSWYYNATAFPNTTVTLCPVLRLGEITLINAEARINLADFNNAAILVNTIRTRNGLGTASFTSVSNAYTVFSETWQKEMYRQGDRFSSLIRWGTVAPVLGSKGFVPGKNNLLPVPQSMLNIYPNIIQNPGY
ncbi:RagB/SusD family nutrient uptake outer membrane protein [Flavitalea flava]